jgi:hypothetical protein
MNDSNHSNPLIDSDIEEDFKVIMQIDGQGMQNNILRQTREDETLFKDLNLSQIEENDKPI